MSTGYTVLIDGYNVIKGRDDIFTGTLQDNRRFLRSLVMRARFAKPVRGIYIVYDGSPDVCQPNGDRVSAMPREVFATESADSYIRDRIRSSPAPEKFIIVSDDREIMSTAKSFCAFCMSTVLLLEICLKQSTGQERRGWGVTQTNKRRLSYAQKRRLEDELKEYWGIGD
ncbi:MAG: NYN domain-containing protein [Candidatus Omnitrophica bacterium]|nr:NYN domain-containing protein [Candidatus Omnitrophota bacterium]